MAWPGAREAKAANEAEKIADGHAFTKHAAEFGMDIDRSKFRAMIEEAMLAPTATRSLANGRTAYWSDVSCMVVIVSPNDADYGTAFRPAGGREYFENLK